MNTETERPRCDRCGWPLEESIEKGCVEGNCSQRPLPPRRFGVRDVEHVVGFDPRDAENERMRAEAERRSDERDAVTDARGFLESRNNPHESDAQLIRRLGACCGVLEQERDAALARAEKAEAEVEEWKSKATSYDYDRRDACAEVGRLTAERRADELAVKLDGTIVVRDDDETRDRIAQALMTRRAWNPKTLSELEKSNQSNLQLAAMSLREDADDVLAALREAYQREQDSRGNPMPCLHLDEAAAVVAALRKAADAARTFDVYEEGRRRTTAEEHMSEINAERLAEIEARMSAVSTDTPRLISEIKRLHTEIARLRAVAGAAERFAETLDAYMLPRDGVTLAMVCVDRDAVRAAIRDAGRSG